MNLLMLSGDRTLAAGEHGPFHGMLKELARYWDRIDVICPQVPDRRVDTVHGNVWVHPSRYGRWRQPAHIVAEATQLAGARNYALLVSHDYGLFYNAAGARVLQRRLGLPWVSEIHHVDGFPRARGARARCRRLAARAHVRLARRRVAAFRVVCLQVGDLLRRWGVAPSQIALLPSLYLDRDLFCPAPGHPKDVDVLCCARLEDEKGLSILLAALERLAQQRPHIRARIVGRGRWRDGLKRQLRARRLERNVDVVEWLDGPPAMADTYRRARLLVCTSFSEGNPRVVGEAMACGIAVISTPVGIVPELIADGENGLLCDWRPADLAEKIARLLDDEVVYRRICAAAPAAVQGFDAPALIERLATAYRAIAAQGRLDAPGYFRAKGAGGL